MSANPINTFPEQSVSNAQTPDDRTWLDRIGITASVACAIHCMIAPLLLLLLPAAGSVWSDPLVHWVLAVLVLPLAVWVIYRGYCKHGKRLTLVAAVSGSAFVVAGLIAPMVHTQPLFSLPMPAWSGLGSANAQASTPVPASTPEPIAQVAPVVAPPSEAEVVEVSACVDGCCDTDSLAKAESKADFAPTLLVDASESSCTDGCCETPVVEQAVPVLLAAPLVAAVEEQSPACADACCGTSETVPTAQEQTLGCTEACCDSEKSEQTPTESAQAIEAAGDEDTQIGCTAACCPSLAVSEYTGAVTMGFPAGGVFTMIGSFLLVLAHATNLHACRCFSRASGAGSDCGCPTQF